MALLKYGLTLKRGGFMRAAAEQLGEFVAEEPAMSTSPRWEPCVNHRGDAAEAFVRDYFAA